MKNSNTMLQIGITALGLCHLIAPIAAAQTREARPTLSVAKTEATGVAAWQPAMGSGLAQMIITELNQLPNFKVLESVALDDLRAERALGDSGEVGEAERVRKGDWKGADYTFKTTITRFGYKENSYGGSGWTRHLPFVPAIGGSVSVKHTESEVQIDWRIIDNATREIVDGGSGRAVGKCTGNGFNFASWHGAGFANDREFLDSALGKATMKALAEMVGQVKGLKVGPGARVTLREQARNNEVAKARQIKGKVSAVDGREVWLSLGSNHGFAKGDKVAIYKPIPKKNRKGEVIATTYEQVAVVKLSKVQKDCSAAECGASANVCEDWPAAAADLDIEQL
jgi:curli biogenesis system outer membrane secretion channel CsgG